MGKMRFPSKEKKYENTPEANFKNSEVKESNKFNVIYKQNGSMELTVGRELLHFEAHKTNPVFPAKYKDGLPKEIIEHPDFQTAKNYFIVTKK